MYLGAKDGAKEKPAKQEKKKPAKPKKPKAQSENSQAAIAATVAPKAAAGSAQGTPSVKPKRKKPGTAVKRKVQPIAVDPKGKRMVLNRVVFIVF